MLLRFLARRRDFRARVEREATDLMLWMGDGAYAAARQRMREARGRRDRDGERLWAKVAVHIARKTGHKIGADRWPEPTRRVHPNRREIADRLVDIAHGIVDLSHGRNDAATLHNIGVSVRQILDFTGRMPALVLAADDVIAACEEIALESVQEALRAGVYPPAAEVAGRALQRFRGLVLATPR
jgi:hypothetical protein